MTEEIDPKEVLSVLQRRQAGYQRALEKLRGALEAPSKLQKIEEAMKEQQGALERLREAVNSHVGYTRLNNLVQDQQRALEKLRSALEISPDFGRVQRAVQQQQDAVEKLRRAFTSRSASIEMLDTVRNQQMAIDRLQKSLAGSRGFRKLPEADEGKGLKASSYVIRSAEAGDEPRPGESVLVAWGLEERPGRLLEILGSPSRRAARVQLDEGEVVQVPMGAVRTR